ncbi:MAG: hypothetical protein AAGC71_10470 [Pseudomonadota bacterium]
MLARIHWLVGVLGLVAFVVQGQYLAYVVGPLADYPDGPRMLFRSSHIYLMFASVLNLALAGTHLPAAGWARRLHQIGAAIVIAAPAVFIAGFIVEPTSGTLDRPISRLGLYLVFGVGVVWAVTAARLRR